MATRSGDSGADYTYRPTATTLPAAEDSEYEEAVAAATSPLIQELYRAATRGYVGGVVADDCFGCPYAEGGEGSCALC